MDKKDLYVGESQWGRGVFCNENIGQDEIIEFCPMIVLPEQERKWLDKTLLYDYYFEWDQSLAIALGFGSLYNHSYDPNAIYEAYYDEGIMIVKALMNIPAHTEILISYNQDPEDKRPVWFEK